MNKLLPAATKLLKDIATLRNPAAAAGLVAVVLQALPGVSINSQLAVGIITLIALCAGYLEHLLSTNKPTPVALVQVPVPVPVPAPNPVVSPEPIVPIVTNPSTPVTSTFKGTII